MWLVVKACRSEKTASGMARVPESSQMANTLRQTPRRALDLWLSRGWTMALYLDRKNNSTAWIWLLNALDEDLQSVSTVTLVSQILDCAGCRFTRFTNQAE